MASQRRFRSLDELSRLLPADRPVSSPDVAGKEKKGHDGKGAPVRVFLDTKGRKGKSVTVVAGLQHNPETMQTIARILKQHCGAGGTVKEGAIEIQGDNRTKVAEMLGAMNYRVK